MTIVERTKSRVVAQLSADYEHGVHLLLADVHSSGVMLSRLDSEQAPITVRLSRGETLALVKVWQEQEEQEQRQRSRILAETAV